MLSSEFVSNTNRASEEQILSFFFLMNMNSVHGKMDIFILRNSEEMRELSGKSVSDGGIL